MRRDDGQAVSRQQAELGLEVCDEYVREDALMSALRDWLTHVSPRVWVELIGLIECVCGRGWPAEIGVPHHSLESMRVSRHQQGDDGSRDIWYVQVGSNGKMDRLRIIVPLILRDLRCPCSKDDDCGYGLEL